MPEIRPGSTGGKKYDENSDQLRELSSRDIDIFLAKIKAEYNANVRESKKRLDRLMALTPEEYDGIVDGL